MAKTRAKCYWLLKTEPDSYSIDGLQRDGKTHWDGVRNYQARNYMRDGMKIGDAVLIYHSGSDPAGVAGLARVCKEAYADFTALDPQDHHYDPKATPENPIWMMVDVEFVAKFGRLISLDELKKDKSLDGMVILQRGNRLSVTPVEAGHFKRIVKLASP